MIFISSFTHKHLKKEDLPICEKKNHVKKREKNDYFVFLLEILLEE